MKNKTYLLLLCLSLLFGTTACRKNMNDFKTFTQVPYSRQDTLRFTSYLQVQNGTGYLMYINDTLKYSSKKYFTGSSTINQTEKFSLPPFIIRKGLNTSATYRNMTIKLVKLTEVTGSGPYGLFIKTRPDSTKGPDSTAVVFQRTIHLSPRSLVSTLIFFDSAGTIGAKQIETTASVTSDPGLGHFKIRVVNFGSSFVNSYNPYTAVQQFGAQMQSQDSLVVAGMENIPYGGVTDYKEFDYGTYQFRFKGLNGNAYYKIGGTAMEQTSTVSRDFRRVDYIQSYPFQPGGVYTVYINADSYSIGSDRLAGQGSLDQVAKVQFVNALPDYQNITCILHAGSHTYTRQGLSFGTFTIPLIIGTGDLSYEIKSDQGTLLTGSFLATRLSNISCYLIEDTRGIVSSFNTYNVLAADDFVPPVSPSNGAGVPGDREFVKINLYNLVADIPAVAFSYQNARSGYEVPIENRNNKGSGNYDISYKTSYTAQSLPPSNAIGAQSGNYDQFFSTEQGNNSTPAPNVLYAHLSYNRKDTLNGKLVGSASGLVSSPQTCSIVLVGRYNTTEPAKAVRIIKVQHGNYLKPSDLTE